MKKKSILFLFVFSFLLYLGINYYYWRTYGWHATWGIEAWWYYYIGHGANFLAVEHPYDIHKYLFQFLYQFFDGIQVVFITSIFLSSLYTIAVALLADKFYGEKIGFMAGLVFTILPSQAHWRITTYTADIFIIPAFLFILYFFSTFLEVKKKWISSPPSQWGFPHGILLNLLIVCLLLLAIYSINVTFVYALPFMLFLWAENKYPKLVKSILTKLLFIGGCILAVYLLHKFDYLFTTLWKPQIAGFWIQARPADMHPATWSELLVTRRMLIVPAFFGFLVTLFRKEKNHFIVFAIAASFLAVSFWSIRTLRYTDFPIAVYITILIDEVATQISRRLPPVVLTDYIERIKLPLTRKSYYFMTIAVLLAGFTYMSATEVYYGINGSNIIVSEPLYDALAELKQKEGIGECPKCRPQFYENGDPRNAFPPLPKIFVNWAYIWVVESISGLPVDVENSTLWWMSQEDARKELSKDGIKYVLVNLPMDARFTPNEKDFYSETPVEMNINGKKAVLQKIYGRFGYTYRSYEYLDEGGNVVAYGKYYNILSRVPRSENWESVNFEETFLYHVMKNSVDKSLFKQVILKKDKWGNVYIIYEVVS